MLAAGRPECVGCECVSCEFLPTARFRFLDDHCNPMRIGFDFNILSEFLHLPRCTPSKPTVVAYPPLVYPLRQVRLLTGRWHTLCCSGALGQACAKGRLAKLVNLCIRERQIASPVRRAGIFLIFGFMHTLYKSMRRLRDLHFRRSKANSL